MRTSFKVKRRGVNPLTRESEASFLYAWYAWVEAVWADEANGEPRAYEEAVL